MTVTIGTLLFSLVGLAGLFMLKEWEFRRGRVVFPALRERLDMLAVRIKELAFALLVDAEKLPPALLHFSRAAVHVFALFAAKLLRYAAGRIHVFANLVSHKRSRTSSAPRSEFLRKVLEHKNGGSEEERV